MTERTAAEVSGSIDHTLLKPEATIEQIGRLVGEAQQNGFAAVCINGRYVGRVRQMLGESSVGLATVVGFPLGATTTLQKATEAADLARLGATEIDMVGHLPSLLECDNLAVRDEVAAVVDAAREQKPNIVVKVIIETAVLMADAGQTLINRRLEAACRAIRDGGAQYVKTSTGFHPLGGATVESVFLLRKFAGDLKVKAAGGIRNWRTANAMLDAGADRLGCSSSVEVIQSG